jgi:HSP20 family protein
VWAGRGTVRGVISRSERTAQEAHHDLQHRHYPVRVAPPRGRPPLRRGLLPVFGRDLGAGTWTPATDIRESEREVVIELELAGVRPESVDVTTDRGVLRVRGEKRWSGREASERVHVAERMHGAFERAFRLPKGLDESAIAAEFEHGVLRIRLPKSALPQPRRIEVRVAEAAQSGEVASIGRSLDHGGSNGSAANGADQNA